MVWPWCSEFHQVTEPWITGSRARPTMDSRPAARAAVRRSSMARSRPITPRYRNSRISSDVRRGSQSHHVPHIGLPHRLPVSRVIAVKAAPIGAQAIASTSHSLIRQTSAMAEYSAINANTNRLIHALGTWM